MRLSLPFFDGNAACAEVDGDLWYPEKGGATLAAKRICDGCEIKAACLKWSLDNAEPGGMWGGVSENQRRRLLQERRRGAA
jgi:WhiB family redox-sensing transcriptional regulator